MAGTSEATFPPGPWVLVLGMHRSGTSALAGALGRLGLALPAPDDLVRGRYDNPVHYESAALTAVGDAALASLGGSWSAPPPLEPGWQDSAALAALVPRAAAAARRAFPAAGPVLWKDPRLCLLLPWWRRLLPGGPHPVLVWRSPDAVARSLRARQGFPLSLGLALWQRYAHGALTALAGSPAYVLSYEALLADPAGQLRSVAAWLETSGAAAQVPATALDAAALSVSADHAHHGAADPGAGGGIDAALDTTVAALDALAGAVATVPAPGPDTAPAWMADALEQRRTYEELYARYMRYIRLRRRIPFLGRRVAGPG